MAARVERLEAHHLGSARESGIGRVLVAGLPVVDLVVRLALFLIANHDRAGCDRLLRSGDRLQGLVVDDDQLGCVLGDVLGLGDNARDLLSLETDLVGREHRLRVTGQRRHPGELVLREQIAGDDGDDSRNRHRGARVDAFDACMRVWAAHDDHVEHARKHDVIDVVTLAVDETRVLFAGERDADATHRLTSGFGCRSGLGGVDCHHATPAASTAFAAAAC